MKDRVSLYPGRVKLTPVSGQENTYDMVRADEPTQEGTPLNKATLLKDATAALLGLDDNAVPDDAFVTLYGLYHNSISFQQLWENASPGSDFGEQTLSLDTTGYQMILIINRTRKIFLIPKKDGVSVSFEMTESYPDYYSNYNAHRDITVNDDSIVFGRGWYQSGTSNQPDKNDKLVPLFILGVKGVKTA